MNNLIYSNIFIFSSLLSLLLVIYVFLNRKVLMLYRSMGIIFLGISIWSLFYGLELRATDYSIISIYLKIQYLGIASIPLFWFRFTSQYSGKKHWVTTRRFLLLSIVPAITVFIVFTKGYHNLFYEFSYAKEADFGVYHEFKPGVWYYVHVVYSYALIFLSILQIMSVYATVSVDNRPRVMLFIVSCFIPFIINGSYVIGLRPDGNIDLTPIGFLFMVLILLFGVLNSRLMQVKPMMLGLLFESMPVAFFTTDENDSIVSISPRTKHFINKGFFSEFKLREIADMRNYMYNVESNTHYIEFESGIKTFRVDRTTIYNSNKEKGGFLYIIHDTTAEKRCADALQKSELYNRKLMDNTLEGIMLVVEKGLVSVNPELAGLSGYSLQELKKMSVYDLVFDPDILTFNAQFNKLLFDKSEFEKGSFRLKTKDGSTRWMEFNMTTSEWFDSKAVLIFVNDISAKYSLKEHVETELSWYKFANEMTVQIRAAGVNDINERIALMLKRIGEKIGLDHCCFVGYTDDCDFINPVIEWDTTAGKTYLDLVEKFKSGEFPWWESQIEKKEVIYTANTAGLPSEALSEIKMFDDHGIRSIFCVPIVSNFKITAVLGFLSTNEHKKWLPQQTEIILIISNLLGEVMLRLENEVKLKKP